MSDSRENTPENADRSAVGSAHVQAILVTADGQIKTDLTVSRGLTEVCIKDVGMPIRVFRLVRGSRSERPVFLEGGGDAVVRHVRAGVAFSPRDHFTDVSAAVAKELDACYGAAFLDEWRRETTHHDRHDLKWACVDRIVLCRMEPFK